MSQRGVNPERDDSPVDTEQVRDTEQVQDYAETDAPAGGKLGRWWAQSPASQKLIVAILTGAVLATLAVAFFGGDDEEQPASMAPYSPPVVDNAAPPARAEGEQSSENREERPTPKPRPEEENAGPTVPADVPQDDSNDSRVTRATYVLDDVVNDPEMSLAGFDNISERLNKDAGLTPDSSVYDTFQMLEFVSGTNTLGSRASQPRIVDNGDGIYKVEYDVSGALAPIKRGDSDTATRKSVGAQMEDALDAGISVPVTFTIDLNGGTVSTDTARWW